MKFHWPKTIEAFVRNPSEQAGGSLNTGTPSLSIRAENGGWALYSYETCIARRWTHPVAGQFLFWVSTLKYTATTNRQQGRLHVELARLGEPKFEYHADPCTLDQALAWEKRVADGVAEATQALYAPGFGPTRGKNRVQTTYGELFKPKGSKPAPKLINRKGDF